LDEETFLAKRQWWQIPRLHTEHEGRRKVTWLELFYDLVFAVVISQLAQTLTGDVPASNIWKYALLFIPAWFVWISMTIYNERFETEGLEIRFFFFLKMFPVIGLAVFAPTGLGAGADGFAISYMAARLIIIFLWLRASYYVPRFRPAGLIYATGFTVGVVFFTGSLFFPAPLKFVFWTGGLFLDLLTPWFSLAAQKKLPPFSVSKMPERYGSFVMVVLGESVVGVIQGLAKSPVFTPGSVIRMVLGMSISFGLWWIYFDFVARRPPKPHVFRVASWSYLHLPLVMGIAATGAANLNAITEKGALWLMPLAVAVCLGSMGLLEFNLRREADEPMHPWVSPVLKLAGAFVALFAAWIWWAFDPTYLMALLLVLLVVQMGYGLLVWFNQELPAES
jgi:low temperature requirement protein LtrA